MYEEWMKDMPIIINGEKTNNDNSVRYAENELDLVNQILQEKDKKAFKYDCLIKRIKEELNELRRCNYSEYTQGRIDELQKLLKED